jgi:hypothetical protein
LALSREKLNFFREVFHEVVDQIFRAQGVEVIGA